MRWEEDRGTYLEEEEEGMHMRVLALIYPPTHPPTYLPWGDFDGLAKDLMLDDMGYLEGTHPARVGVVEIENLD